MQLGALVPFGEFGGAPESVRDYAQGLEAAGYDFVEAPDHVLGALGGRELPLMQSIAHFGIWHLKLV